MILNLTEYERALLLDMVTVEWDRATERSTVWPDQEEAIGVLDSLRRRLMGPHDR